MLQRILKDMFIETDLLAELDEEQKQILFCKMREEQKRRYEEREEKLEKDEKKKINKPSINGKTKSKVVSFLLDADNQPWTWVIEGSPVIKNVINLKLDEDSKTDKKNKSVSKAIALTSNDRRSNSTTNDSAGNKNRKITSPKIENNSLSKFNEKLTVIANAPHSTNNIRTGTKNESVSYKNTPLCKYNIDSTPELNTSEDNKNHKPLSEIIVSEEKIIQFKPEKETNNVSKLEINEHSDFKSANLENNGKITKITTEFTVEQNQNEKRKDIKIIDINLINRKTRDFKLNNDEICVRDKKSLNQESENRINADEIEEKGEETEENRNNRIVGLLTDDINIDTIKNKKSDKIENIDREKEEVYLNINNKTIENINREKNKITNLVKNKFDEKNPNETIRLIYTNIDKQRYDGNNSNKISDDNQNIDKKYKTNDIMKTCKREAIRTDIQKVPKESSYKNNNNNDNKKTDDNINKKMDDYDITNKNSDDNINKTMDDNKIKKYYINSNKNTQNIIKKNVYSFNDKNCNVTAENNNNITVIESKIIVDKINTNEMHTDKNEKIINNNINNKNNDKKINNYNIDIIINNNNNNNNNIITDKIINNEDNNNNNNKNDKIINNNNIKNNNNNNYNNNELIFKKNAHVKNHINYKNFYNKNVKIQNNNNHRHSNEITGSNNTDNKTGSKNTDNKTFYEPEDDDVFFDQSNYSDYSSSSSSLNKPEMGTGTGTETGTDTETGTGTETDSGSKLVRFRTATKAAAENRNVKGGTAENRRKISIVEAAKDGKRMIDIWLEQERRVKQMEEEKKYLVRRVREDHVKAIRRLKTESQLIIGGGPWANDRNNCENIPLKSIYGPLPIYTNTLKNRVARPKNIEEVLQWFEEIEKPKFFGSNQRSQNKNSDYFYGLIDRGQAEAFLKSETCGTFLLRLSDKTWGYVLSLKQSNDVIRHYLVDVHDSGYQFFGALHLPVQPSLNAFVEYYKHRPISLINPEHLVKAPTLKPDKLSIE